MKSLKVRLANMVKRLRKGSEDGVFVLPFPEIEKGMKECYDKTAPPCPCCGNHLIKTRGVGYSHACQRPVEEGKQHIVVVIGDKAIEWDGTRDHWNRLSEARQK